jgi:phospholipid/cholesterol/gamma-HCH transport system substrate-binding protein
VETLAVTPPAGRETWAELCFRLGRLFLLVLVVIIPMEAITAAREIGLVGAALFLGLNLALDPRRRPRATALWLPLGLYALTAVVSLFTAVDFHYTLKELRTEVLKGVVMYYTAAHFVYEERHLHQVWAAILVSSGVMAVAALYLFHTYGGSPLEPFVRAGSLHSGYGSYGTYLVEVWPYLLLFGLALGPRRWWWVWLPLVLLNAIGAYLTFSRAVWLAMVTQTGLCVLVVTHHRLRNACLVAVAGLLRGSAVLFNGIRVGEVTALALDPARPRQVNATIAIDREAPVRKDTEVSIDFQGLTGSPVVTLTGGSSSEAPTGVNGEPPLLIARTDAGQTMSQSAREVLHRLDGILAENAKPLQSLIANIDTFAAALARNSDRVDGIVAGLERMTGGAAAKARTLTFNLRPLRVPEIKDRAPGVQVIVPEPTSLMSLDTEKIAMVSADGVFSSLPNGQWSDGVTRIVQAVIIRGLEDSRAFGGVSRPLDELNVDFRLAIDVRKFQIGPTQEAEVELSGKIIDGKGRIIAAQVFRTSAPAGASDPAAAVAGFDQAMARIGPEIVTWVARTVAGHAKLEPAKAPKDKGN